VVAKFTEIGAVNIVANQRQAFQLADLIKKRFGFPINPQMLMNQTPTGIFNLINRPGGKR
jgi:hypothetical protein